MLTRRRTVQAGLIIIAGMAGLPAAEAPASPVRSRRQPRNVWPEGAPDGALRLPLTDDFNKCLLIGDTVSVQGIQVRWDRGRGGHDIAFLYFQHTPAPSRQRLHVRLLDDAGTVLDEDALSLPFLRIVEGPIGTRSTLSDMVHWPGPALSMGRRTLACQFQDGP